MHVGYIVHTYVRTHIRAYVRTLVYTYVRACARPYEQVPTPESANHHETMQTHVLWSGYDHAMHTLHSRHDPAMIMHPAIVMVFPVYPMEHVDAMDPG